MGGRCRDAAGPEHRGRRGSFSSCLLASTEPHSARLEGPPASNCRVRNEERVRLAAVVFAGALATGLAVAPAQAAPASGEQSLAAVLTADGNGTFDNNWYDYDIVTQAVLGVLAAKPDSNVKLLTDGSVALTAFIPNDRAFRLLAHDIGHKWYRTEKGVFDKLVKKLGIRCDRGGPALPRGARRPHHGQGRPQGRRRQAGHRCRCFDRRRQGQERPGDHPDRRDRNDYHPRVNPWQTDINEGNKKIAHGITRVLRPINL